MGSGAIGRLPNASESDARNVRFALGITSFGLEIDGSRSSSPAGNRLRSGLAKVRERHVRPLDHWT